MCCGWEGNRHLGALGKGRELGYGAKISREQAATVLLLRKQLIGL